MPIAKLGVADVRLLVSLDIGLPFLMVRVVEILEKEPLVETEHYRGDLLVSALKVSPGFFRENPDIRARLETILQSVPPALDKLDHIDFDTTSEALDEATAEFRKRTERR